MAEKRQPDFINHPPHYGSGAYEHVKVAEAWGLVENAFIYNCTKYLARADKKGNRIEDLKKARWYLDREIKRLEKRS
jgi:hypothetical protein